MHAKRNASKTPLAGNAAIPLACVLAGWAVTALLYLWSVDNERTRGATEFTRYSEKFRNDLSARVNAYIDTLPGLKALSDLEKNPNELRFSQFVSAISLQKRFPDLAFFFTADRVRHDQLDGYIAAVRSDRSLLPEGRPDFAVKPEGRRPEYLVIRHTVPDTVNTLGYDLLDPTRLYRIEVERAIASGMPTATEPMVLAKDRNAAALPDTTSVVVRLAVYRTSAVPPPEARAQALDGIVGVALQTRYLVETALTPDILKRLKLRIVDRTGGGTLVFDDAWLQKPPVAVSPQAYRAELAVEVANRTWIIEAVDRHPPGSYWFAPIPLLILASGLTISLLLALLMRTLVSTTRKAEGAFADAMARLTREQRALEEAQALASVGSWEWDIRTGRMHWSAEMERLYNLTAEDWIANPRCIYDRIPQEERPLVRKTVRTAVEDHIPFDIEHRMVGADGQMLHYHARGRVQRDEDGAVRALMGTVQDITGRRRTEAAAAAHERRYRLLFENSLDGVLQTRQDGRIIAANPAACALFGRSEAELLVMRRGDLIDATDTRLVNLLSPHVAPGSTAGELRMRRAGGELFDAEISSSVYDDSQGRRLTSLVIRDITERKKSEREIVRLAFNDGLTGLPNRRLLLDRASLAFADARRRNRLGALLFIDLDNFKTVNDAKGHATGDTLLRQVAERLMSLVREGDSVARLGGDEFVILLNNLDDKPEAASRAALVAAERVKESLCAPYSIDDRQYLSTASIGVSIFPKAGQQYDDVLREADTAMYRAKAEGRNRIAFFVQSMQTEVEEQMSLEHALERAIREDELHMVAQSQFDDDGNECGAELLLRWTQKSGEPVSPSKFIPLAEETGLILRIGDWVIEQGCKAVARLQELGLHHTISVNVSPRQFRQPDFVERVRVVLAAHRVRSGQLVFEVTESLLIGNLEEAVVRMRELNALGIRFSIDDFGTGYSSLAYLKKLPLYELKIDRTFVQDAPSDPNDGAIVQLILGMAKHLRLRVVAEGVETDEQRAFLLKTGCDSLQGFLMARPVPLSGWLDRHAQADVDGGPDGRAR